MVMSANQKRQRCVCMCEEKERAGWGEVVEGGVANAMLLLLLPVCADDAKAGKTWAVQEIMQARRGSSPPTRDQEEGIFATGMVVVCLPK